MSNQTRFRWAEHRAIPGGGQEKISVIADLCDGKWLFFEKDLLGYMLV